jgi:hypothetical protein
MHPLDDPLLTLTYAGEHLDKLETLIRAHEGPKPHLVTRQFNAQDGCYVFRFELTASPPMRERLIIADVLYHLRAALDHLAWRLARLTTETPNRYLTFPIRRDRNTQAVFETLRELPTEAQQIIEGMQPYNRGDGLQYDLLWALHDLCTIAKHRHINIVGIAAGVRVRIPSGATATIERRNQRDIIVTVPTGCEADEDFEPQLSYQITLGMQEPGYGRSLMILRDIYNFVRCDVFPKLTGFFPERIS